MMLCRIARLLCMALIPLAAPAPADDRNVTIRPNPFVAGQSDIIEDGSRVGTVRQNPFVHGQYDLYDRSGQRTGVVRENPFVPGELDVERE
jgi:hypothetical protein